MLRGDTSGKCAGGAAAPPRKMVIKPFKSQPKLPSDFEEQTWTRLQSAVVAVMRETAASQSKEELYRAVEDMCMHKLSANLYNNLYRECETHINEHVDSLISQAKCTDSSLFLSAFDKVWQDHCQHMNTIRNIFLYLDRTYCGNLGRPAADPGPASSSSSPSSSSAIWDFGLTLFNNRVQQRSSEIESKLIVGLLAAVESDRRGMSIDHDVVKRLLRMLISLRQYHCKFQVPFLRDTERFFQAEGQVMIERSDPSEFLIHVESRLSEALEMVKHYLDPSTKAPLQQAIEAKLLLPHVNLLTERGLGPLLAQIPHRTADLRRMSQLLERVNASELLKQGWATHMRAVGESLVSDPARDKTLIEDLLELLDRMELAWRSSFGGSESYRIVLKSSFEYIINLRQSRPAELLARFVDRKMKGEKGLLDTETEAVLEKAMSIFRFLSGKDVFEAFYKKLLSKRLLLRKSSDLELEKSMITKLKTECGSNYTSKLEGMFQDVDLSRDAMAAYNVFRGQTAGSSAGERVQADFQVLTTGYWPATPPTDSIRLPQELVACKERFISFYNNKYQGRRLVFAHTLERCIMMAHFPLKKKELEVSLFQAIVLVGFNRASRLSFSEILALTDIEDGELRRTLQSLANGIIGTRVLTKEPKGKDVSIFIQTRDLLPGSLLT